MDTQYWKPDPLLSGLIVPATSGTRTFEHNRELFVVRSQRKKQDAILRPTEESVVDGFSLIQAADDSTMLAATEREYDSLILTEEQIIALVERNLPRLKAEASQMNFFIFKAGNILCTAQIDYNGGWQLHTNPTFGYYTGVWRTALNIKLFIPRHA